MAVSSTGQFSDLGFGTAAQVLTSNGAGVSPTWKAAGGGTTALFSAYLSANATNVTGDGTVYIIPFDTAVVNLGSAYNPSTGVFTAPVTGNYMFTATINIGGMTIADTSGIFSFDGSGSATRESRYFRANFGAIADGGQISASGSYLTPMTAGDTMSVYVFVAGSTKTVSVVGTSVAYTTFAGYLIP
jgi:hypothetical protein